MKNTAKQRVILWSIVSAALVLSLIVGIVVTQPAAYVGMFGFYFKIEDHSDCTEGEAEFAPDEVNAIEVEWQAGEVVFQPSVEEQITLRESGPVDRPMCWKLVDGTLKIYPQRQTFFGFSFPHSKALTVSLPRSKKLDSLKVECVTSSLLMEDVRATDVTVESVSGAVNVFNVSSETLHAETVSGACTLTMVTAAVVHTETVSGDFNAKLMTSLRDFHGETVSGSITLQLPNNMAGFSATHESVSGGFTCDFTGTNSGEAFIAGNGAAKIHTETISGNTYIQKY